MWSYECTDGHMDGHTDVWINVQTYQKTYGCMDTLIEVPTHKHAKGPSHISSQQGKVYVRMTTPDASNLSYLKLTSYS